MPLPALSHWPGRQPYRPCVVGGRRGGGPSSCRDDITKELERADFLELFCIHFDLFFHNIAAAHRDLAPLCALSLSLVTSREFYHNSFHQIDVVYTTGVTENSGI